MIEPVGQTLSQAPHSMQVSHIMATGPDDEAAKAAMLIVIAAKKVTIDKIFFIRLKLIG